MPGGRPLLIFESKLPVLSGSATLVALLGFLRCSSPKAAKPEEASETALADPAGDPGVFGGRGAGEEPNCTKASSSSLVPDRQGK